MNSHPRYGGATALSLLFAAAVFAQTAADSPVKYGDSSKTMLKHGDKNFVDDTAKSSMEEIAISRIALEKASNPQVKEFAQMMVSDHTGASTELTTLATAKGVMPPKEPNVERWMKKSAKDFDGDYMNKMIDDHQEAVRRFEKEAKNGGDPELAAFASKTLPKLQTHLAKAKEIKKMVK